MTTSTSEIVINGVRLDISSPEISTRLVEKMKLGFYEAQEAKCIKTAAQKGDRLLEIGAGVGFLSCIAAQTQLFEAITVVEANPQLIGTIKRNHQINNAQCEVLNVVLSPEPVQPESTAPFYVRADFWASSLSSRPPNFSRIDHVPLYSFQALLDNFRPTFIACDIEGGEYDIFQGVTLAGVKKVLVELHQKVIGRKGMKRVFDTLSEKGFHYDQWHSSGSVVLFSHIER
jgi:FkbM family methyltransferase